MRPLELRASLVPSLRMQAVDDLDAAGLVAESVEGGGVVDALLLGFVGKVGELKPDAGEAGEVQVRGGCGGLG